MTPLSYFKRQSQIAEAAGRRRVAAVGDTIVAEAHQTLVVDGYDYFAPDTVDWDLLEPSAHTSVCPWKGVATYYDVVVDGTRYPKAAWTYENPSDAASRIKGHVAFWHAVKVSAR